MYTAHTANLMVVLEGEPRYIKNLGHRPPLHRRHCGIKRRMVRGTEPDTAFVLPAARHQVPLIGPRAARQLHLLHLINLLSTIGVDGQLSATLDVPGSDSPVVTATVQVTVVHPQRHAPEVAMEAVVQFPQILKSSNIFYFEPSNLTK